jgi:Icc-related predicted phosphoesterase
MRIIATADTHFQFDLEDFGIQVQPDDVFILAGDFMYAGYESEWYKRLESLEKIDCTKYLVAGNHDLFLERFPGPALQELHSRGVDVVGPPGTKHPVRVLPNGWKMMGVPFVTGLPNWAFNSTEEQIEKYLDSIGRVDLVVSHSPPAGIGDTDGRGHYGIKAFRRYIKRFEPEMWINGHVHEGYGEYAVDGCMVYNVAMCNSDYRQVNKPMIIEVE